MRRMFSVVQSRPRMSERSWWFWIILPGIAILFLIDPMRALWDRLDAARGPWVTASVSFTPFVSPTTGKPVVCYLPDARRPITGKWKAWPEIDVDPGPPRNPLGLAGGEGTGSYRHSVDCQIRAWDWFFNPGVPVPTVDYRICVFYTLETETGVRQITPKYCSDWRKP